LDYIGQPLAYVSQGIGVSGKIVLLNPLNLEWKEVMKIPGISDAAVETGYSLSPDFSRVFYVWTFDNLKKPCN